MAESNPSTIAERPSFPSTGKPLTSVTEECARPIREAAWIVQETLKRQGCGDEFLAIFGPRWRDIKMEATGDSISSRAAWAMVGIWTVARLSGAIGPLANFFDAEDWFLGNAKHKLPSLASRLDPSLWPKVLRRLEEVKYDGAIADLLPYILDIHGPGSRQSVMRDASTAKARAAKRKSGVFYTPADVAEYMAEKALGELDPLENSVRCYDPACGSGVFLRALLNVAINRADGQFDRLDFATQNLYGTDIDPMAVEAACFVLLFDCLEHVKKRNLSPWHAWHVLRLNLSVIDSLSVAPPSSTSCEDLLQRNGIREALLSGSCPSGEFAIVPTDADDRFWFDIWKDETPINSIFPEIENGFDLVIGNPPYAAIGTRDDGLSLEGRYASLRGKLSPKDDLYPLFIEKSWQLTQPRRNVSVFVVPLSIAFHRGAQFRACRRKMLQQGGRWQFAFFDREPHALFGEDVKTRNAILFRRESESDPPRGERSVVETGPLRKWTSRSRERLFSTIQFTSLENADISAGIPKLCGQAQSHCAATIFCRKESLADLWSQARSCLPAEAFHQQETPTVFVASTAYNFLNVFRPHLAAPDRRGALSENPLLMLRFPDELSAATAFAILSSRLTYWLWQVQCDGFHVPRWFVESIPFNRTSFTNDQLDQLVRWGDRLWVALQDFRIVSLNRGRETIAYRPLACELERDEIDRVLMDALGLKSDFADELRHFVRSAVVVDESDTRRDNAQSHFQRRESTR